MQIILSELELQRAIEVYMSGLYVKPVKVLGFDLAGMRSKDGLSVTVTMEVEGEVVLEYAIIPTSSPNTSDEPKQTNSEPKPKKIKSSKQSVQVIYSDEEVEETDPEVERLASLEPLNKKEQETYTELLQALNNNPNNSNRTKILELVEHANELTKEYILGNQFYKDWVEYDTNLSLQKELNAMDDVINESEVNETETSIQEQTTETTKQTEESTESSETTMEQLIGTPVVNGTLLSSPDIEKTEEVKPIKTNKTLFG